ncbi:MAG: transposase [Deltaproteobacteria bacterium]|jgi:transposase|nr:transposase [Deltaproteobacteria bacterium]
MPNLYNDIDILFSEQFDFGHIYLLDYLSESLGLTKILSDIFPSNWKLILTLAEYFALDCSQSLDCSTWVKKANTELNPQLLYSQRKNGLFSSITNDSIFKFYEKWSSTVRDRDFFALDNTFLSTYSDDILEAEYGYNRDREKLKQINLSLIFGETSGLPLFSSLFHGNMNDVRTLKKTIEQFKLINQTNYSIFMDKNFFSLENINFLTTHNPPIKFTISLPQTVDMFEELILDTLPISSSNDSVIVTSSGISMGVSKKIKWYNGTDLYAHVYRNYHEKLQVEEIVKYNLIDMLNKATLNPELYINDKTFNEVLNFRRSSKTESGYTVKIKPDMLSKKTLTSGWLILLSNCIKDTSQAIRKYRKKDVVEKAFDLFQNHNALKGIKANSYINLSSTVFVCFISLILLSEIHDVMDTKNLYSIYSMRELLETLSTQRVIHIKDKKILKPITIDQRRLFKHFNCPLPNTS